MTNKGMTTKAWLYMVAHGRCTCAELAEAVGSTRKQVENLLLSMVNRGFAERFPSAERANGTAYGVTPRCKVPQNTCLADIMFAVQNPRPHPQLRQIERRAPQDDIRIPQVVPGWTPPKMQCARGV
jgi:hypothetical protein